MLYDIKYEWESPLAARLLSVHKKLTKLLLSFVQMTWFDIM